MGRRIRELEDALAIFQAGVSNEPHPLLTQDLLSIKHGPEIRHHDEEFNHGNGVESLDALGTLHISESGESTYFGRSAGSEVSVFTPEVIAILLTGFEDTLYGMFCEMCPLTQGYLILDKGCCRRIRSS
jgi:hypothetical protein